MKFWNYEDGEPINKYPKIKKIKEVEWTKEQWEQYADDLLHTEVNHNTIDGYVAQNDANEFVIVKYNKNTELYIEYQIEAGKQHILEMRKKTWREYEGNKYLNYIDEIS